MSTRNAAKKHTFDSPVGVISATVRVLKVAASIMGQVWIFVKKTIQFVKIFPLRFQIDERFVSLVLITAITYTVRNNFRCGIGIFPLRAFSDTTSEIISNRVTEKSLQIVWFS
jgi:hypothetical protein